MKTTIGSIIVVVLLTGIYYDYIHKEPVTCQLEKDDKIVVFTCTDDQIYSFDITPDVSRGSKSYRAHGTRVREYAVRTGDTFESIATRLYGNKKRWNLLFRTNAQMMFKVTGQETITPEDIKPGMVLEVPDLVHKSLAPHVKRFQQILVKRRLRKQAYQVKLFSVVRGVASSRLRPNAVGTCSRYRKEIIIDPDARCDKFTVFHELAHCVLNLDHVKGRNSLMSESVHDKGCKNPERYLNRALDNLDKHPKLKDLSRK